MKIFEDLVLSYVGAQINDSTSYYVNDVDVQVDLNKDEYGEEYIMISVGTNVEDIKKNFIEELWSNDFNDLEQVVEVLVERMEDHYDKNINQ